MPALRRRGSFWAFRHSGSPGIRAGDPAKRQPRGVYMGAFRDLGPMAQQTRWSKAFRKAE